MKDLLKFPLDIQYFASEGESNEDTGAGDNNQGSDEGAATKTFTQAEVDALIAKEKARAKKQSQKQEINSTKTDVEEPSTATQEVNPYIDKYAQAEIKFAMVQNGIDAKKAARAIKLIDHKEVLSEDGEIDDEALNSAIADLLKEWPELAPSKNDDEQKGIRKIGSEGKKDKVEDDLIAKAFGNVK